MRENRELIELVRQYYLKNGVPEFMESQKVLFVLNNYEDVFNDPKGHITASAFIINERKNKVLLTHHKKLDKWIQLGGHIEEGESVIEAAKREAFEESGLRSLQLLSNDIFDIDIHEIPDRENEPKHYHYDIRFLFMASEDEFLHISSESNDLKWVPFRELGNYKTDKSVLRMVKRLK